MKFRIVQSSLPSLKSIGSAKSAEKFLSNPRPIEVAVNSIDSADIVGVTSKLESFIATHFNLEPNNTSHYKVSSIKIVQNRAKVYVLFSEAAWRFIFHTKAYEALEAAVKRKARWAAARQKRRSRLKKVGAKRVVLRNAIVECRTDGHVYPYTHGGGINIYTQIDFPIERKRRIVGSKYIVETLCSGHGNLIASGTVNRLY